MTDQPNQAVDYFDTLSANYEASTGGCTRELARHLVEIIPSFDEESKVLDNACGNGVVAQEIVSKYPDMPMEIACADAVQAMVDLAKHAVPAANAKASATFQVMPGERLGFPDGHFTHSVTNQGIMFFKNGAQGLKEIHRTLKPGGIAIITTWKQLGYIGLVHQAQKAVMPDQPPFRIPISQEWSKATYLEQTLKDTGFTEVDIQEKQVYYTAENVQKLCENLMRLFAMVWQAWKDEDKAEFKKQLEMAASKTVSKVQRARTLSGDMEDLVGVPNIALVAVVRK